MSHFDIDNASMSCNNNKNILHLLSSCIYYPCLDPNVCIMLECTSLLAVACSRFAIIYHHLWSIDRTVSSTYHILIGCVSVSPSIL